MYGLEIVNGETTLVNNHSCHIHHQYKISTYKIPMPPAAINWKKINGPELIIMSKGQYNENIFNNEEKKDSVLNVNSPIQPKIQQFRNIIFSSTSLPANNNQERENPIINQQRAQIIDISDESDSDESDSLESKQNVIQGVLSSLQIGIESGNDQRFWNMLSGIRCYDKDEGIMRETNIKLPKYKCKEILRNINNVYMPVLKNKIEPYLNNIELEEDKKNFMTHIICKGKQFYDVVLNDPTICLYLCDKYYPLHTWLSNRNS